MYRSGHPQNCTFYDENWCLQYHSIHINNIFHSILKTKALNLWQEAAALSPLIFVPPFNNIMMPANGNPIDAPLNAGCGTGNQAMQNHHVIVTAGADPTVPLLNRVPASIIANKLWYQ